MRYKILYQRSLPSVTYIASNVTVCTAMASKGLCSNHPPTHSNDEPVQQVLKQVVNLSYLQVLIHNCKYCHSTATGFTGEKQDMVTVAQLFRSHAF